VIDALRAELARCGIADVSALVALDLRERVAGEVGAALTACGARRDLRIDATGGTPRRYRILTRDTLLERCPSVAALYRSPALRDLIERVAGETVFDVPYRPEEFIATRLEFAGDTHGWHWDDYAFALVWVLEAPPADAGAQVEFVSGVPWCKTAPNVEGFLRSRDIVRRAVAAGSVYLLRADTTLHRVAPLLRDERRDALCFTYARAADLERDPSHETLEQIYATSAS
jgi:hypothetical protein